MGGLGIISLCKLQGGNFIHPRPQQSGTNATVEAMPTMWFGKSVILNTKSVNAAQKCGRLERIKVSLFIVACYVSI